MKFFLAILPLLIGSSSCTDPAGNVGPSATVAVAAKGDPRNGRYIYEPGYRYAGEPVPVPVNHVSPYYYRQYYTPGYAPVYEPNYPPVRSTPYVEVHPSYGHYPPHGHNYPVYGHPYSHPPYGYYRPYAPVFVKDVRPVHVPGEHHRAHHHQFVDHAGKPVHVNHVVAPASLFGASKTVQVQYVEEPVAEQPKVSEKKVEVTVGGADEEVPDTQSVYQRSSVQGEPENGSPHVVPVVGPPVVSVVVPEVDSEVQAQASSVQSTVVKYDEDAPVTDVASERFDHKRKQDQSKNNGRNKKPLQTNKKPLKKTQELVPDVDQASGAVPSVVADNSVVVPYSMPMPSPNTDARSAESVVVPEVPVVPETVVEQVPVVPQAAPVVVEVVKTLPEPVPAAPTVPETVPVVPELVRAVPVQAVIMTEVPAPVRNPVVVSKEPVSQQGEPKAPPAVKQA